MTINTKLSSPSIYITILEDNIDEGWSPTFLATSWPSLRRIMARRLGMNLQVHWQSFFDTAIYISVLWFDCWFIVNGWPSVRRKCSVARKSPVMYKYVWLLLSTSMNVQTRLWKGKHCTNLSSFKVTLSSSAPAPSPLKTLCRGQIAMWSHAPVLFHPFPNRWATVIIDEIQMAFVTVRLLLVYLGSWAVRAVPWGTIITTWSLG